VRDAPSVDPGLLPGGEQRSRVCDRQRPQRGGVRRERCDGALAIELGMGTVVVVRNPVREQRHELLQRQRRPRVIEPALAVAAAAGVLRQAAQERLHAGEVQTLDLALLLRRVLVRDAELDFQSERRSSDGLGAELKPVIDPQPLGRPADRRPVRLDRHRVAERGENLCRRWPQ
jgi:hypothetical protein